MRSAALGLAVCLAAGCDSVWRIDRVKGSFVPTDAADGGDDVPVDAGCSFSSPQQIQSGGGSYEPTISDDGLELFFVRGSAGTFDLWRAARTSTSVEFGAGAVVSDLVSASEDTDPALSADGTVIVFKSNRSGAFRAYQSTRGDRAGSWSTPVLVPGLATYAVSGLDLSPDGLAIYYDDYSKLVTATRTSVGGAFGPVSTVGIDRALYPSVSPDGLELYYNGAGIVRRTRATIDDQFAGSTATMIDPSASDGDLSSSGRWLVYMSGGAIWIRERLCL